MLRRLAYRSSSQIHRYAAFSRGFATEDAVAEMPKAGTVNVPALSKDGDLDWDAMASIMDSDSTRRELQQLRTTFLDTTQKMDDMAKETPDIDWAKWKKELDPKLVGAFEAAYNSINVPEYEDESVKQASAAFNDLQKQASELAKHSKVRMEEIQRDMKSLDHEMAKISTMTVDDVLEAEPDLRKQLQQEVFDGKYFETT